MVPQVESAHKVFSEKEIWERYYGATEEMLKYIKEEDVETFLSLVDQRQQLMEMLQAIPKIQHVFGASAEGAELREKIKALDMQTMYKARTWLNKSRRNNMTVKSYDITGYEMAGNVFNKEY